MTQDLTEKDTFQGSSSFRELEYQWPKSYSWIQPDLQVCSQLLSNTEPIHIPSNIMPTCRKWPYNIVNASLTEGMKPPAELI